MAADEPTFRQQKTNNPQPFKGKTSKSNPLRRVTSVGNFGH
jgi:hypothetical protein